MRFWYFVVFWDLWNMNGTIWFGFLTFSSLLLKSHFNKIIICKYIHKAVIVHTYIKLIYYVFHVICILQLDPLSRKRCRLINASAWNGSFKQFFPLVFFCFCIGLFKTLIMTWTCRMECTAGFLVLIQCMLRGYHIHTKNKKVYYHADHA